MGEQAHALASDLEYDKWDTLLPVTYKRMELLPLSNPDYGLCWTSLQPFIQGGITGSRTKPILLT